MADNPIPRGYDNKVSKSPRPRGGGVPDALSSGGRKASFSTGYPNKVSRSSKPTAGEPGLQGKVPRGVIHNEASFAPSTRKFGNVRKGS